MDAADSWDLIVGNSGRCIFVVVRDAARLISEGSRFRSPLWSDGRITGPRRKCW
jgi:hypothetical protein